MRILQVIHQFPPYSSQGSEVYCFTLSKHLSARDDVRVFHVSNTKPRRPQRLTRECYEGLSTYHCIDGGEYARMSERPNTFLQSSFSAVLDEFAPQIVHFHNFVSLGDDLVSLARSRGVVVAYTLHDFGLICPTSLLLRHDGALCTKANGEFFQDCCPVPIRPAGDRFGLAERLPSLARWRMFAGQQPRPVPRSVLMAGVRIAEWWWGAPMLTDIPRKRDFYLTHTRRIFQDTHLFFAPSDFLRRRYISCGVPAEKILYARYGMRLFPRPARVAATDRRIRFGYIGAFHAHKGVEVLVEAFVGLGDRATLHLYGSAFGSPISETYWRRISENPGAGVVAHGAYDNTRIAEILSSLDVVVVPSLWYENSPLTIQEAFIAGVPVITADVGGMAELVRHGRDGLHFHVGDVGDLRRVLTSVVEHPEMLDSMRREIPDVPGIDDQAQGVRREYDRLLSAHRDDSRPQEAPGITP